MAKALQWMPVLSRLMQTVWRSMSGDEFIDWGNPVTSPRAVREYLIALDENNPTGTLPNQSHRLTRRHA